MVVRLNPVAVTYCSVSLLSMVSKVFEKLVNDRVVDHLREIWPFP